MSNQAQWLAMHRMATQDSSIKDQKLKAGTFQRILAFAIPYRKLIAFFLLTVIFDSIVTISSPLLLRELVDKGISRANGGLVTTLAIAVALIAVADALLSMAGRFLSSRIGEGLIYDLRSQVFTHIQRQSIAFFTRTQTGALISRINSDVIGAQQAFTTTLSGVVSNIFTLALVAGAMAVLSWQITVISLLLLPIFLLPAKRMGKKIQGLTRESYNLNAEMSSTMTERFNVSGALLVNLYGNAEKERVTFATKARRVADIGIKIALLNRIFFVALTSVAAIATAVAYGVGGHLAIAKTITIGSLLAITTLLARLYGPLTALSNVRVDIMSALVSFERVFEVLDLQPMVQSPAHPIALPAGQPLVKFDEVSFAYPKAEEISLASLELAAKKELVDSGTVLDSVTFTVAPGTLTAIVGPSGAGKSTISSLLPRLYDVSSGSISINGVDIRELSLENLRSTIGVVTQDSHMFHESIEANLRYARPEASVAEIWEACDAAQIGNFIRALPNGLDTVVGERGHRLSGGERQRLAIARLLLKAPAIVILDEATAHLDSENEALVQEALKVALKGRTSIVIAHRLSTIQNADQILVVESGRVVERGRHDELVKARGLYFDLYERQTL
jgi:ATP-binding cassette subfamily B protein